MGEMISDMLFTDNAEKSVKELLPAWWREGVRGQVALEIAREGWDRPPLVTITSPGSQMPLALAVVRKN